MLQLLLMLAAAPPMNGVPDRVIFRDPLQGPTQVTNLWIIPPKVPDCRTDEDIRRALEQKAQGDPQFCDPPKSVVQQLRRRP